MRGRTGVVVALFALVAASCSWSQYAGNAARTGANELDDDVSPGNAASLSVAWQAPTGGAVALSDDFLYARREGRLEAFAADGSGTCSGTPRVCEPRWFAELGGEAGPPVVDGGSVYVGTAIDGSWQLAAFPADGAPGGSCPIGPAGCPPLWTATWAGAPPLPLVVTLAVTGGRVYASVSGDGEWRTQTVYAFDAAGELGCSAGPPRSCAPLFSAAGDGFWPRLPTVAEGRLFVPGYSSTRVFDAAGIAGCTAGTCAPLYELAAGVDPVSVAGGIAYSTVGNVLRAFDATGATGCGGSPRVCEPLWEATLKGEGNGDPPVVAGGRVYVLEYSGPGGSGIEVFDASGQQECSGTPMSCAPLWRVEGPQMPGVGARASANASVLFVTGITGAGRSTSGSVVLSTFDLAGNLGCSGAPRQCVALSSYPLASRTWVDPPAIAFGRVAVSGHLGGPTEVLTIPS